ncbi:hypothetical protein Tco_0671514 [Tanacetum coccineum]
MLAPSGGGLILYQAYGNLYAMTGRKAHLLEDKQISSVGVFDEVFSIWKAFVEIYVTWAHLEKKQTRLRTYTNISQEFLLRSWRRHHRLHVTPSQPISRRRHKISRRRQTKSLTTTATLFKLENQVQRLMGAHLAPKQPIQVNKITSSCEICSGPYDTQYYMENPEQAFIEYASSRTDEARERRLSILGTQLGKQQDYMISTNNLLWKTVSEKLDDTPTRNTAGNLKDQMNFASTDYPTKEELRGKGIKSSSKLLSPKYLSQSSIVEQNRNPSSLKCVHFVNSIIILNKEDEAKEKGNVKSNVTNNEDHEMTFESEEEFEEETKEETEEEEEDNPKHFDTSHYERIRVS